MNALTVLKQDHQNVEALFQRFEKAAPDDARELRSVADKVIEHLSVHTSIEEQLLYPALREKAADHDDGVLEALEEHHAVKVLLNELEKLAPTDERFSAKLQVVVEQVRHHVEEEEGELFATAREAFTVQELEDLGEAMQQMKQAAPTRPHPFSPDTPPFNILIGVPMAVLDRVISTGKRVLTRR